MCLVEAAECCSRSPCANFTVAMLDFPRKVFAERFPDFVEPWARMTIRHGQQMISIGLATCGKGGTRLATRLGIQTTRQTILRRIIELPDSSPGVILFLGIDDFSFRRGSRFGTILVNLESRRVVDLLPDREAETSATWMRQQLDFQRGEKYPETPSRRHRLSLLHDKLPSCFFVGLKNCAPKSRKRWPGFVSFTRRSIWPITWCSNLPRCCAPARESTS